MDPPLSRSTCTHNVYPSTYTCTCTHNVYVHTMYILPHNYTCTYTCTCTCIMISTTTIFRGCTCLHAMHIYAQWNLQQKTLREEDTIGITYKIHASKSQMFIFQYC